MTSSHQPRRRSADLRPPRPAIVAPAPADRVPGGAPDEVLRSIDLALDQARRGRRHVTLISMRAASPGDGIEDLADLVRRTVRSGDGVWRDGTGGLALLLADIDGPGVEPVLARMRLRLRGLPVGRVVMGRAAAAPGIGAADLLELARSNLPR